MCVCVVSPQGPCDSLGISVAGGAGSPHDNVPLFIATMDTDGLAATTYQVQVGSGDVCVPLWTKNPSSVLRERFIQVQQLDFRVKIGIATVTAYLA